MRKTKNIYTILRLMYYITKIFGLTPFEIKGSSFQKSKINIVWSLLCLTLFHYYTLKTQSGLSSNNFGFMEKVTRELDWFTTQAGMLCCILGGCLLLDKILAVLREIDTFDKKVEICFHIDLAKEYHKSEVYLRVGLFFTIAVIIISMSSTIISLNSHNNQFPFDGLFLYITPTLINIFVDLQFCVLVLFLKQRFGWLNQSFAVMTHNLKKHLRKCNNRIYPTIKAVTFGFMKDRSLNYIINVREQHYYLCNVCNKLNAAYSPQILLIVLQNFVTVTAAAYYAGKHMIDDEVVPVEYVVYTCIQLSVSVIQLIVLVKACSITTEEARELGILIHDIKFLVMDVELEWKKEMQTEITFFSLQLLHQNVKFTACNLFIINESLLFSIVGAITTYLIIVVQFDDGSMQNT